MTSKTTGKGTDAASQFGQTNGTTCAAFSSQQKPFILNARMAKVEGAWPLLAPPANQSLPPFSQVIYAVDPATGLSSVTAAYGIWIEAVPSANIQGTGFVDFHIRSCWSGAGSARLSTLGTIVRLYEPR